MYVVKLDLFHYNNNETISSIFIMTQPPLLYTMSGRTRQFNLLFGRYTIYFEFSRTDY